MSAWCAGGLESLSRDPLASTGYLQLGLLSETPVLATRYCSWGTNMPSPGFAFWAPRRKLALWSPTPHRAIDEPAQKFTDRRHGNLLWTTRIMGCELRSDDGYFRLPKRISPERMLLTRSPTRAMPRIAHDHSFRWANPRRAGLVPCRSIMRPLRSRGYAPGAPRTSDQRGQKVKAERRAYIRTMGTQVGHQTKRPGGSPLLVETTDRLHTLDPPSRGELQAVVISSNSAVKMR